MKLERDLFHIPQPVIASPDSTFLPAFHLAMTPIARRCSDAMLPVRALSEAGAGIFITKTGEPLSIYVDPALTSALTITNLIKKHGGLVCPSPTNSQVLIISPVSTGIFDEHCHPLWLPLSQRLRHRRRVRAGGREKWKEGVIVQEEWAGECVRRGRVLGAEDDWGGYQKGG